VGEIIYKTATRRMLDFVQSKRNQDNCQNCDDSASNGR